MLNKLCHKMDTFVMFNLYGVLHCKEIPLLLDDLRILTFKAVYYEGCSIFLKQYILLKLGHLCAQNL